MLNITLSDEAERYLVEILAQEKTTSNELLQRLLHQHWQNLQTQKTVLERMGDRPRHFLSGPSNLSDLATLRTILSGDDAVIAKG